VNKYRKKPVVVEAASLEREGFSVVWHWIKDNGGEANLLEIYSKPALNIHSLEGIMTAQGDDYIIKGIKGEFYPCKKDIFEATYEALNNTDPDYLENFARQRIGPGGRLQTTNGTISLVRDDLQALISSHQDIKWNVELYNESRRLFRRRNTLEEAVDDAINWVIRKQEPAGVTE